MCKVPSFLQTINAEHRSKCCLLISFTPLIKLNTNLVHQFDYCIFVFKENFKINKTCAKSWYINSATKYTRYTIVVVQVWEYINTMYIKMFTHRAVSSTYLKKSSANVLYFVPRWRWNFCFFPCIFSVIFILFSLNASSKNMWAEKD